MEKPIDVIQEHKLKDLRKDIEDLKKDIEDFEKMLQPLIETYKLSLLLGKYIMAILVFLSILIGIILGLKQLYK